MISAIGVSQGIVPKRAKYSLSFYGISEFLLSSSREQLVGKSCKRAKLYSTCHVEVQGQFEFLISVGFGVQARGIWASSFGP